VLCFKGFRDRVLRVSAGFQQGFKGFSRVSRVSAGFQGFQQGFKGFSRVSRVSAGV